MSDNQYFSALIDSYSDVRVLCVGDVMLDRFIYGEVERISPEAPIPILRILRERAMLGGAGNVVANLRALGATVHMVSVIGQDEPGFAIREKLDELVSNQEGLVVSTGRPTTVKSRFVASTQQVLRADFEETREIGSEVLENVLTNIKTLIPQSDVVILSDYGKGVLNDEVIEKTIAWAAEHNLPVIVDPKGNDYRRYRGAALVTPNRDELSAAAGLGRLKTNDEICAGALKIINECGIQTVLATRSEDGMSIITQDQEPIHVETEALEVFDVSGAGDTVVATMAATLGTGASLQDAARLANAAGGVVVGKSGTAVIYAHELKEKMLNGADHFLKEGRIAPLMILDEALARIEQWRAKGLTVGFTNGCFDLLHPGHISLLEQSKDRCDRLIVGLNTDASVSGLKGPNRPVHDEHARSLVLGATAMVDMVILFKDETPLKLIEAISPDLLVKGQDYTVETVVGAEHVLSYGGEVYLAELKQGFSTTRTLERLAS